MKFRHLILVLALALPLSVTPGCALFQGGNTPSSQVLADIRLAETALLTAETIINVEAKKSGKPVSEEVKAAEALIFSYITAAKQAAQAGDTVTVEQKLDLFNQALADFNAKYLAE